MNLSKVKALFNQPIDIAGLVFFRIAFGLILLWDVFRYLDKGWVKEYWIDPKFFFTFDGFHWVQPWSGDGMYYHFYALGILAFFIAIGFLYRISTILFFLGFSFVFLIDKTNYLNHFYLIILLSFIMIFLPANRAFSLDAKLFPRMKRDWVPGWTLWWLKIQLGIVYFYGGVAKINSDWLQGEPVKMWLSKRTDFPIIGQWFTEEWMVYFFTYSGLIIDLLIFPLLIFKKTRLIAAIVLASFHMINSELFEIGIFPWLMLVITLIFFPSEKLRFWNKNKSEKPESYHSSKWVLYGLSIYIFIQLAVPLRHYFIEGNVNWTEEGHRFAWHMKLRDKTSIVKVKIVNLDTQITTRVKLSNFLSKRQRKKMKGTPDMLLQFAKHLKSQINQNEPQNIEISVQSRCSLNGRPRTDLVDPNIDLSEASYPRFKRAPWILPLTLPLKDE